MRSFGSFNINSAFLLVSLVLIFLYFSLEYFARSLLLDNEYEAVSSPAAVVTSTESSELKGLEARKYLPKSVNRSLLKNYLRLAELRERRGGVYFQASEDEEFLNGTSKFAYATLLTSNSFMDGVQVLVYSVMKSLHEICLDDYETADFVVMVVPHISLYTRSTLLSLADHSLNFCSNGQRILKVIVKEVDYVDNPYKKNMVTRRQVFNFTKLRVWLLVFYDKVLFMDADLLVLRSVHELFYLKHDMAAVLNFNSPLSATKPTRATFNSGFMLLTPSKKTFESMQRYLGKFDSYNGGDQGFLNNYFPSCTNIRKPSSKLCWEELDIIYNLNKMMIKFAPQKLKGVMDDLKVLHFVRQKPWLERQQKRAPPNFNSHLNHSSLSFDQMWKKCWVDANWNIEDELDKLKQRKQHRCLKGRESHCVEVYRNVFDFITKRNRPASFEYNSESITLATVATPDRLRRVFEIVAYWDGLISLSYFSYDTIHDTINTLLSYNLPWHKIKVSVILQDKEKEDAFPINLLRNIAIDETVSDLVFYVDVDFVPSNGMHWRLIRQRAFRYIWKESKDEKVFVIPAFELKKDINYPEDKPSLLKLYHEGVIIPFHSDKKAHTQTNYTHWVEAAQPYAVEYDEWYEPYFIFRKSVLARIRSNEWFHEVFVDRGRNKLLLPCELSQAGFEFIVVPDLFIIHSFEDSSSNYLRGMHNRSRIYDELKSSINSKYEKNITADIN